MAVFRGDPLLAELQVMGEDMDRAFGRLLANQGQSSRGWLPPADIYETEDDVVIELDVPDASQRTCPWRRLTASW